MSTASAPRRVETEPAPTPSVTFLDGERPLYVPAGALSLDGFRAWATSDEFPERVRISYIDREILVDMSPEEFESHTKVKGEITHGIITLNKELDLGEFFMDGTLLTNVEAGLSTEPDAAFVLWASYEAGRVALTPRKGFPGQYLELVGTPDWVLEIVSRSSVRKDTVLLREAYHRAGVPEYWLVDARYDEVDLQILRRRRDRYVAVASRDGWRRSAAFGRSFRLDRARNRIGRWDYTLHVRPE